MAFKFNFEETSDKYHRGAKPTKEILAHFLTNVGATPNDGDSNKICYALRDTDMANSEMKITVNDVELNTERILERLIGMLENSGRKKRGLFRTNK